MEPGCEGNQPAVGSTRAQSQTPLCENNATQMCSALKIESTRESKTPLARAERSPNVRQPTIIPETTSTLQLAATEKFRLDPSLSNLPDYLL